MNNELFESINQIGKTSYDAMKELYDINIKIAGQFSEQQLAFINLSLKCTTSQMDMMAKSKGYKDIFSGQTALINDASEKAQGIARNTIDIINESKDEVSAWVEKGVEDIATIIPLANKSA